jgi:predicted RNA binding protein YcfA (HicA-like mRNA interferase family)
VGLPKQIALGDLIRRFRELGWEGPISGGKHRFMRRGRRKVRIPNPHGSDIDVSLLAEILRQAGVTVEDWTGS